MIEKQNALYQLIIADWLSKEMKDNPYYPEITKCLDTCWKWLLSETPSADDLYYLLDDGTEFGGLFILMQMDDQASEDAWDVIFNACAKVTLLAYEAEGQIAPGLIENANEDQVDAFFEQTSDSFFENAAQVKASLKGQLSAQEQPDRQALLAYLGDLINKRG